MVFSVCRAWPRGWGVAVNSTLPGSGRAGIGPQAVVYAPPCVRGLLINTRCAVVPYASRVRADQSCLVGDDNQLRAVARTQFRHRVADMGARSGRTEEQFCADLVVAQAAPHPGQHFSLALGENREPVLRSLGCRSLRGELADQTSGDPRRE